MRLPRPPVIDQRLTPQNHAHIRREICPLAAEMSTIDIHGVNHQSLEIAKSPLNWVYGISAFVVWTVFYRLFLHPLAGVPGPFAAKFTGLWRTSRYFKGTWYDDILNLHNTYGRVVRIAPNEVSFVDGDALKRIYGHGKPCKTVRPLAALANTDKIVLDLGKTKCWPRILRGTRPPSSCLPPKTSRASLYNDLRHRNGTIHPKRPRSIDRKDASTCGPSHQFH
jgi:hypothetical protein